jgi:hypothetical protein
MTEGNLGRSLAISAPLSVAAALATGTSRSTGAVATARTAARTRAAGTTPAWTATQGGNRVESCGRCDDEIGLMQLHQIGARIRAGSLWRRHATGGGKI